MNRYSDGTYKQIVIDGVTYRRYSETCWHFWRDKPDVIRPDWWIMSVAHSMQFDKMYIRKLRADKIRKINDRNLL